MSGMRALGLGVALVAVGCQPRFMPSSTPPAAVSSLEPFAEQALDNGLTLLVQEDHKSPLVALIAMVNTGSATEGPYQGAGISHFVEHMLFKGTERRPVGAIEQEIKSLGGDFNAFTSFDYTGYTIVVPREHLAEALDILADVLSHASFDPAELEKEREVIVSEMRLNRDDPDRALSDTFWQTAFLRHPYRHPVIGYEDLFRKLTREDVVNYYQATYAPNNTVVAIVGDVETKVAAAAASDALGKAPRRLLQTPVVPDEGEQISPRERVIERPDVKIARVMLGFHTVSVQHDDLFPLDVLAIILGEGESAKLVQRLVKEQKLVYDIGAYSYTPKDPGIFGISCELESDKIQPAVEAIFDVIEEIKRGRLSYEELEKAKAQVLTHYYAQRQQVKSQAANLVSDRLLTGDARFSKRYVEGVWRVDRDEVARVARQYLARERVTRVELVPTGAAQAAPAAAAHAMPGGVQRLVLPNGLRVLVREDHTIPLVHLQAYVNGGVRMETDETNGLSHLTAQMLLKGTKHRDALAIAQEVESLGGALAAYGGNNSFGVGLTALSHHLERSLELLHDLLTQSTFPEDELAIEKTLTLSEIRQQEEDIFHVTSRALRRALFGPHPYRMHSLGTQESVSQTARERLREFYRTWCAPSSTVISVFGDIRQDDVERLIQKGFGSWNAGAPPALHTPEAPRLTERIVQRQQFLKQQAVVMLGFQAVSMDDPKRYAFDVVSGILSGSGGRLYAKIREARGLSYTVGSFSVLGPDPGAYVVYAATSPETAEEVRDLLLDELRTLPGTITEEELAKARRLLLGQRKMHLETNAALALEASLDELFGLGHQHYLTYDSEIQRVTLQEVIQVVRDYLDVDRCVVVMTVPE